MQRYFIKGKTELNQRISLEDDDYFHLRKVMRKNNGDQVVVIDETGTNYLASVVDISGNLLEVESVRENDSELDVDVTLIYALSKGEKFDMVLQKATELGVKRIVPLMSSRCVVRLTPEKFVKKRTRYEKILKEASEQSRRNFIPVLDELITVEGVGDYQGDFNLVAYEQTAKDKEHGGLKTVLENLQPGQSVNVIVGSEGGFSQEEVDRFNSFGYVNVSLGKRILRSETAPLYLLSAIGLYREVMR